LKLTIKPKYLSIFTILAVINFIYIIYFYKLNGYLPSPFINDKSNTFMDFYNPLYWSQNYGAYDTWGSVYPPFNFFILTVISNALSYNTINLNAEDLRLFYNKDIIYVILLYIISTLFCFTNSYWAEIKSKSKIYLIIIVLLSPVVLYTLERGNLIFISLPFLAIFLNANTILKKAFYLSVLINIKPYFILLLIVDLIRNYCFKYLLLTALISALIFIIFGLIINEDFYLMPFNILGFASSQSIFDRFEAITFPSSISSYLYFTKLTTNNFFIRLICYLIQLYLYYLTIKILIVIWEKKLNNDEIAIASLLLLSNISMSIGGYSFLFYIVIFPLFLKEEYKKLNVYFILIFIGIFDIVNIINYFNGIGYSYLSDSDRYMQLGIGFGSFLRPILNFLLLYKFLSILKVKYYAQIINSK
jgi:hypothetical protein